MNRGRLLALITTGHAAEHWYLGIFGPVLPFLVKDLNISLTEVGILYTGRSVFSALSSASTGYAIDRLGGGKWVLVVCLAGIAIFYGGMSMASGLISLIPLFWLSGLFSHLWHPPSMGLLGERFTDRRGFALGLHGTGANISQTLAPLVAGYLLLIMDWRATLLVNMTPLMLAALLLGVLLPPFSLKQTQPQGPGVPRRAHFSLLKDPAFGATALIAGALTVGHHGLIIFLPILLMKKHAAGPEWIGLCLGLYAASAIIPEAIVGYVSDRISRKFVLIFGLTVGGLSLVAIPAAAHGSLIILPLVILGVFLRSLRPVIFAHALDTSPPHLKASTVGFLFTTNQCFTATGPLLAGMLSDYYGVDAALWFFGGLTLGILPLFAFLPNFSEKSKKRSVAVDEGDSMTL